MSFLNAKELGYSINKRLDILNNLKRLINMSETEYLNIEEVADLYGVEADKIEGVIINNLGELLLGEFSFKTTQEILNGAKIETKYYNEWLDVFKRQNNKKSSFDRYFIFRIGILLDGSELAREVRKYLVELEYLTNKNSSQIVLDKLEDIKNHEELLFKIWFGFLSSNNKEFKEAIENYRNYIVSSIKCEDTQFSDIQKIWERRFLEEKTVTIKTTDDIRCIGKTYFLVKMAKKYDGYYVTNTEMHAKAISNNHNIDLEKCITANEIDHIDGNICLFIDETVSDKDFEKNKLYKARNYVRFKRVDN